MEPASTALSLLAVAVAAYAVRHVATLAHHLASQLEAERERHRDEIAELTNKVQHPSVFQLTPRQTEHAERAAEPTPDDEFELAGHVLPDVDEPPEGTPLPVGEAL